MHSREWKLVYFLFKFRSRLFLNVKLKTFGSSNGLAMDRWQAITETNGDKVLWHQMASLVHNELTIWPVSAKKSWCHPFMKLKFPSQTITLISVFFPIYLIRYLWQIFARYLTHWGLVMPYGDKRSGSTLAQVMDCCVRAPSHYLNQCWLIISKVEWHSSKGKFTRDTSAINHWNNLEN